MPETPHARLIAYGVAVLATGLSVLLRLALFGFVSTRAPFITFFPAIFLSAYLGGLRPGLLATLLSAAAADYFLIEPRYTFRIIDEGEVFAVGLFVLTGILVSVLAESRLVSQRRMIASERRYAVTLESIGDAVIATDTQSRITFMNPSAEALTGWPLTHALGRPLAEVFRIVNEQTRQPVDDPAAKVLRLRVAVGLANHTALLSRDGRETPIDDCGTPIIDDNGAVAGVVLVFCDVTQRRRAEEAEAVRRANTRLDLAMRGSNISIWECDMPDGRIETSHPTLINVWESLGYEAPTSPWDFPSVFALLFHPDDHERVWRKLQELFAGDGQEYESAYRVRPKDGSSRWHLARGRVLRDPQGKPVRFIGTSADITDLKEAEEALRERERQLESLMGHLPGLAYRALADEHWTALFASKGIEDLTGYPADEFTSRRLNYADIMLPEDRPATREAVFTALRERRMYEAEHRIRHKDGSVRWIWARGHGVFAPDGSLRFIEGLNLDMTRQKQAEEELRESEERFRGTFENAAVGIVHADSAGRFLRVNQKFCAIVGYSREELLHKTLQDIIHPDELNAHFEHYEASFAQNVPPPFGVERRFLRKDGTTVWVEAYASFQHDASGRPVYVIGAVQDITERKRVEEALRQANDRVELALRSSNICIWEADMPDGHIENAHLSLFNVWESLGYDPRTMPTDFSSAFAVFFHPDDQERVGREIQEFLASDQQDWKNENRALTKDGSTRWYLARGTVLRDPKGKPVRFIGTSGDITDLKRTEEALRESERRFRTFVDHAADAFFLSDEQGRILDVNRRACESLGYTRDELIGMTPFDFVDIEPTVVEDRIRQLLAGGAVAFESQHRRKDGTVFPVETRGKSFQEGGRQFLVAMARDVTDRKQAEERLRESEQRWRSLTEALPQLVWSATPDGACDYFSTQWTEHTGVPESDLLGWRWLEVLHPDDREPTRRFWLESVAGHHAYDIEYRVRHRDGEYRWFKTRGVPIRDTGGNIVKWFGTCTDITELRDSEERFRGTFENAAVGIGHRHLDGRFLRVNQKFCNILGYTRDELLQKTGPGVTHPDDLDAGVDLAEALVRGELPGFTLEKRYLRRDGSPVWVDLSVSLQRDEAGKPDYFIGIVQDISNRKRLEGELRQAKEAAEAANRAKDEFLANVSHEIRTPMNAIIGMTELVLDTPLDEGQRQGLKTVKSAADSLLGIINDLLDFSKIEAGKLELVPADFSLREAVGDTLRALAVRAHKKGLELIYQVQPYVPDALVGDAGRLRQVLLNLVGNAVKFTDDGEVVVTVRRHESGDRSQESEQLTSLTPDACLQTPDSVSLVFTIRDTGIGIPPDQQERIFRAFEQEDTSTTRKYGGTGLGLTIASRLVALMGGSITVDSTPGRGSTFAFTAQFALQLNPPESIPVPSPVSLHNLPVLVVDDNATNRHILAEWLRSWQMEPTAVGDGMAAMDALWHRAANGRPYALVLLDARMPDADGLTVAARIRERAELASIRIILLTSGDRTGDPARFRELRIGAQLLKPVQQDELLDTIFRVMSRPNGTTRPAQGLAGEQETKTSPVPSDTPLCILVAEDNEFNAQLLEQLLARRGHRVQVASNGRQALTLLGIRTLQPGEQAPSSPDPQPLRWDFDLLLLDIHMPELDGFQVVHAIRDCERTTGGHLPIIALTARSRKEDREQCLAAGMDEFLTKPIQATALWAAIDGLMRQIRERGVGADQSGAGSSPTRESDLLNPRAVLAACGDDAVILERICQTFRSRLPDHLKVVREALRDQESSRLREAAHKLAGMMAAFSTVAGGVASELEDLAANGQIEEAQPFAIRLESMADELMRLVGGLSVETLREQAKR